MHAHVLSTTSTTVLASVPGRFFFNRTKLKNTSRRPSVQLETDRPGVEATTVCAFKVTMQCLLMNYS